MDKLQDEVYVVPLNFQLESFKRRSLSTWLDGRVRAFLHNEISRDCEFALLLVFDLIDLSASERQGCGLYVYTRVDLFT